MTRYWKADKETSLKIVALLDDWVEVKRRGSKLAKKVGAKDSILIAEVGFGTLAVVGFVFKDESKIDPKQFVRLRHDRNDNHG